MKFFLILLLLHLVSHASLKSNGIRMSCVIRQHGEARKNLKTCTATFTPSVTARNSKVESTEYSELVFLTTIDELIIKDQLMHYVPRLQTSENIATLTISNTQLQEIHKNDIGQFPALKTLKIVNNKDLTRVGRDLFDSNPKLKSVDLTGNGINYIPVELSLRVKRITGFVDEGSIFGSEYFAKKCNGKIQTINCPATTTEVAREAHKSEEKITQPRPFDPHFIIPCIIASFIATTIVAFILNGCQSLKRPVVTHPVQSLRSHQPARVIFPTAPPFMTYNASYNRRFNDFQYEAQQPYEEEHIYDDPANCI